LFSENPYNGRDVVCRAAIPTTFTVMPAGEHFREAGG